MRNKAKSLVFMFVFALSSSKAMCAEWKTAPRDDKSQEVAVSAKNEDGGKLVVMCDMATKIVSIRLKEPRAHWQTGALMQWITKADEGTKFVPSAGIVIAPTRIMVKGQSRRDISTMEQAKTFFIIDVGGYSRIFTAVNFKKSVHSVLHACSNH